MSNTLATVQKNLQGFGAGKASCGPSCDNTRLVCLAVGNKNYLVEVDSCGNQVTDAKPLGTCSVRPDGTSFPLDDDGNQIIDINEIDMDINSVVANGSVITFSAEDGTKVTVDICGIVAANCNSPLVVNPDGSLTYTDNAGNVTVVPAPAPETVTTLVVNDDGSLDYTSEDGTVTNVAAPTVSSLVQAGSVITHTNGDGVAVSFDVCAIVAANCNSPMVVNEDGSVSYKDNAGSPTVIPAPPPSVASQTPNGTQIPVDANNMQTVTQCCPWTQEVDAGGNVTNPSTGEVSASGYPAGTTVTTTTDENGINADTCPVGNVLEACNADTGAFEPVQKGDVSRIIRPTDLTDNGLGFKIPFADSGDGCTPAAPTPKQLAFADRFHVSAPEGTERCYQDGAWDALTHLSDTETTLLNAGHNIFLFDADLAALPQSGAYQELPGSLLSQGTITNNYTCRQLCCDLTYRNNIVWRMESNNGFQAWGFQAEVLASINGEPMFSCGTWNGQEHQQITGDGPYIHTASHTSPHTCKICLEPGESVEYFGRYRYVKLAYAPQAVLNRVILSAFLSKIMCSVSEQG